MVPVSGSKERRGLRVQLADLPEPSKPHKALYDSKASELPTSSNTHATSRSDHVRPTDNDETTRLLDELLQNVPNSSGLDSIDTDLMHNMLAMPSSAGGLSLWSTVDDWLDQLWST